MTEQELRAIVRETIARMGPGLQEPPGPLPQDRPRDHASHGLLRLPAGADTDGPCLIEPAVACNHCGYCKSFGH